VLLAVKYPVLASPDRNAMVKNWSAGFIHNGSSVVRKFKLKIQQVRQYSFCF